MMTLINTETVQSWENLAKTISEIDSMYWDISAVSLLKYILVLNLAC